jgi:serine/threonine-protein kinase
MSSSGEDTPELPLQIGEIVADKYRLDAVVGRGGMGIVFRATDLVLDRRVAMKVMARRANEGDAVARFLREGRAAVKLTSDHVARVFEVGMASGGVPFMTMEYLEGRDLDGELEARGTLPVEEAVGYVLQAAEAIAEAHALGIVHRDLKPNNLFLARRPGGRVAVKVLDFGISKVMHVDAPTRLTTTGAQLGTPLYMAPEQMRSSRDVDGRVDVWALGVILYEALTGQAPFRGQSVTELAIVVATEAPRAPRSLRPDLPEGLEAAILRCLEKDPDARFATAETLAAALEPFAGRFAGARTPAPTPPARTDRSTRGSSEALAKTKLDTSSSGSKRVARMASTDVTWGTASRQATRGGRRLMAIGVAVLLLGVAAVGGYKVLGRSAPGASSSPPPETTLSAPPNASVVPVPTSSVAASTEPPPSTASAAVAAPATAATPGRIVPRANTPPRPAWRPIASSHVPTSAPTVDPGSVR